MDKASIGGVLLAIVGIVAGLLIEGGNLSQIVQPTAALIVFGGTLGAVLLQFPLTTVLAAFGRLAHIFSAPRSHNDQLIRLLVAFANKARRNGVVSLDSDLQTIQDPFLKQSLMLAVDGTEPSELRKIMRVSLDSRAENEDRLPAVFESAAASPPPSASLAPSSDSSRSCSILTTSRRWAAASPSPLSPPSTASASPTSSSCPSPASSASACAPTTSAAR